MTAVLARNYMPTEDFESDKPLRDKAQDRPIDGRYPELAKAVRRLLGWDEGSGRTFLTSRMADRRTGVNYSTIAALTRGDRASADSLRKLAQGLGADEAELLQLAGYLSADRVSEERAPYVVTPITREVILENIQVAAHDGQLTEEEAEEIRAILQRRRREKRGEA